MARFDTSSTLKRLRNRYRLVVMNDDTYEEVVTFKLSRLSVYIMLSTIFVLLVGLTVALIVFTPLKYYIPGANQDYKTNREYRQLKYKTDEVTKTARYNEQYVEGIRKVLKGDFNSAKLDTNRIEVPKDEYEKN
jgi:ABC-type dipeptide/oligopeptide/nickel transport system permease component